MPASSPTETMICPKQERKRTTIVKGELEYLRFRIPYRVFGDAGPFLVCVSGAQQSMAVWKSFMMYFRDRYRIVILDLPGQGQAEILEGSPRVELHEQVEVLHQVLKTVGAHSDSHPVGLCGASWGGIVIAAFASRYPKSADKIILGSFGMKLSPSMLEVMDRGRALYDKGDGHAIGDLIVDGFGRSIPTTYQNAIRRQFQSMDDSKLLSFYAHCDMVEAAGDIHDFLTLRHIHAKTLIINGANDTILDLEDINLASKHIPDCQCIVVENVGHFLHFEDESILSIYDEFLSA